MGKITTMLISLAAVATAEPPAGNYLSPQPQPFSSYGPPKSQYGTPSPQYGAPKNTYNPRPKEPSPRYGAPPQSYSAPSSNYGAPKTYSGGQDFSEPANYDFSYDVIAQEYGVHFGHHESRQGDTAKGRYYVLLPDGRKQTVDYTADHNGYNPTISYSGGNDGGYQRGYSERPSSSYGAPQGGY